MSSIYTSTPGVTVHGEPLHFLPWAKITRLNRDMIVTEKIDGINACVIVTDDDKIFTQSRSTMIYPNDIRNGGFSDDIHGQPADPQDYAGDPNGFAYWAYSNAEQLITGLGPGYHYGEWYGSGVRLSYGLPKGEKRFMLFNHDRWAQAVKLGHLPPQAEVSTVLYRGRFNTGTINFYADELRSKGSRHVPGFDRPEGVIAYHTNGNLSFKVTCFKDDKPKGDA